MIACLDEPTFVLDESATTVSPTTPVSGDGDDAMVLVPATTFPTQGTLAPNERGDDERDNENANENSDKRGKDGGEADDPPAALTTVPAFYLDVHEVSARAYAACVAAGACTAAGTERECNVGTERGDHPANCVSADQARAFCASRGKRLPTNDEWTAAAAGADLRPYPWGAAAPSLSLLNMAGDADGWKSTAPRGSFSAGRTPDGVADLAGNVAEWVDVSGANVTRGGSHADHDVTAVHSLAVKTVNGPDATVGFRCAKSP